MPGISSPEHITIINDLIHERRSVFVSQFEKGRTIPDAIIQQLLENANQAPSHKLTEPWRFTIFSGRGREKLAALQAAVYRQYAGEKFKQAKYEQLLVVPQQCSHVIAIGCKRHPEQLPEMEEVAAVACAVQNIYLSMAAYGIGGYWSTGGVTYLEEAKPLFGLEMQDIFMGFLYLGYIKIPSGNSTRTPVEEKITWIEE